MSEKLFEAIAAGDEDAVQELVDVRPELAETRNEAGLSPVLHALYNGKADLAERLLDANPALDVFDAAATGRTRGMEELIDAEPELARNWSSDGFTPLHYAAFFGQEEAARILLERGAEVEVVARNESIRVTPLHSAAAGSHAGDREAAARGRRRSERGPGRRLHAAAFGCQNDDRESAEALLAAGADPSLASDDGKTPARAGGRRHARPIRLRSARSGCPTDRRRSSGGHRGSRRRR